jgi:DNA-binding protein HU-beta
MIKVDIINEVSKAADITKVKAEVAVEAVLEAMKDSMMRGERIELRGFGVFQVKPRKRGIGRNPRTGKEVKIPPGRTIRFKPARTSRTSGCRPPRLSPVQVLLTERPTDPSESSDAPRTGPEYASPEYWEELRAAGLPSPWQGRLAERRLLRADHHLDLLRGAHSEMGPAGGVRLVLGLMSILLAHEMGHYLACRIYGVNSTLPFFIPAPWAPIGPGMAWMPLSFIGTFGAVIRIKAPFPTARCCSTSASRAALRVRGGVRRDGARRARRVVRAHRRRHGQGPLRGAPDLPDHRP